MPVCNCSCFRCTTKTCNNYFTLPMKSDTIKCSKCRNDIKLVPQQHLLEWCENQYDTAFMKLTENQPQEASEILCKAIDTFHRYVT